VGGDGVERGAGAPGQLEVEVVDRLEERCRVPVEIGELVPDEQDVGHRVLARQAGRPPGHLDPPEDLARVVADDVDRAADHLADGLVAT
jgi:hypothetical protein